MILPRHVACTLTHSNAVYVSTRDFTAASSQYTVLFMAEVEALTLIFRFLMKVVWFCRENDMSAYLGFIANNYIYLMDPINHVFYLCNKYACYLPTNQVIEQRIPFAAAT